MGSAGNTKSSMYNVLHGLVQLSHNLLKNIISDPVDGPKHTPNKFYYKRTYIWCQRASHNKFRPTAFSRSVQTPLVRPGFDAVVCVLFIKAHTTDDCVTLP